MMPFKTTSCPNCGHMYSETQIKYCRLTLVGMNSKGRMVCAECSKEDFLQAPDNYDWKIHGKPGLVKDQKLTAECGEKDGRDE